MLFFSWGATKLLLLNTAERGGKNSSLCHLQNKILLLGSRGTVYFSYTVNLKPVIEAKEIKEIVLIFPLSHSVLAFCYLESKQAIDFVVLYNAI